MVNVTHLRWFNLKLVVLTLADYNGLHVMFNILLIVVREVFFETLLLILDNFMLMVHIIVFVHPLVQTFIITHH